MSKAKHLKLYIKILRVGLAALCVLGGAAGVARAIIACESKTFYGVPVRIVEVSKNYFAFSFVEMKYKGNSCVFGDKKEIKVAYTRGTDIASDVEKIINEGNKPLLKVVISCFDSGYDIAKNLNTYPYVCNIEYFKVVEEKDVDKIDEKLLQTIMS